MKQLRVWRLKKGADRRLRRGHPWVFSGEVSHSTKDVAPGEVVELRDSSDHFLAYGMAHPTANIAFRKLSSKMREGDILSVDFIKRRLQAARKIRILAGWSRWSHRWAFSEVDGLPGLIVDAYLTKELGWVVVFQISTAGFEVVKSQVVEAIESFQEEFGRLTIIESPNSQSRKAEGLEVREKSVVVGDSADVPFLEKVKICLTHDVMIECDLLKGQKTGFFLDQQWNIHHFIESLQAAESFFGDSVQVLDICSYVGQWSTQITKALTPLGKQVTCTLVDVSPQALEFAERNVHGVGGNTISLCVDALKGVMELPQDAFDIVICDPPGFVKKKADLEVGLAAYVKLLREALRRTRPEGWMVASSCSGPVRHSDWQEAIADASGKAGRSMTTILNGGHGPDHPTRPEFSEGHYLKCVSGIVRYPF